MWNLISSNKVLDRRTKYKARIKHLEALQNIKGQINIISPHKPSFLKSKPKSKQLEAEKNTDIQYNNDILIEKMFKAESSIYQPKYLNESFKANSLNKTYKRRVQRQIDIGNEIIIKKLQQTGSCYPIHQILKQTNNHLYYKTNILNKSSNLEIQDRLNHQVACIVVPNLKVPTGQDPSVLQETDIYILIICAFLFRISDQNHLFNKIQTYLKLLSNCRLGIIIQVMGNSAKSNNKQIPINLDNYILLSTNKEYRIFKNKMYNEILQQYSIELSDAQQLNKQIEIVQLRQIFPYMVKALYFQYQSFDEFCSSHLKAKLYLERIPLRLSDIKDIPYPDMLHLTEVCLRGFYLLYQRYGFFRIQQSMIGINTFGKAKVWMNSNFSKSYCTKSYENLNQQDDMVVRIFQIIQQNTDPNTTLQTFPTFCNPQKGFEYALSKLHEYCLLHDVEIPESMKCTYVLLKDLDSIFAKNNLEMELSLEKGHKRQKTRQIQPTVGVHEEKKINLKKFHPNSMKLLQGNQVNFSNLIRKSSTNQPPMNSSNQKIPNSHKIHIPQLPINKEKPQSRRNKFLSTNMLNYHKSTSKERSKNVDIKFTYSSPDHMKINPKTPRIQFNHNEIQIFINDYTKRSTERLKSSEITKTYFNKIQKKQSLKKKDEIKIQSKQLKQNTSVKISDKIQSKQQKQIQIKQHLNHSKLVAQDNKQVQIKQNRQYQLKVKKLQFTKKLARISKPLQQTLMKSIQVKIPKNNEDRKNSEKFDDLNQIDEVAELMTSNKAAQLFDKVDMSQSINVQSAKKAQQLLRETT